MWLCCNVWHQSNVTWESQISGKSAVFQPLIHANIKKIRIPLTPGRTRGNKPETVSMSWRHYWNIHRKGKLAITAQLAATQIVSMHDNSCRCWTMSFNTVNLTNIINIYTGIIAKASDGCMYDGPFIVVKMVHACYSCLNEGWGVVYVFCLCYKRWGFIFVLNPRE